MNVTYEVFDHTAVIAINRPEALNALNIGVLAELEKTIAQAEGDENIYVIIITGVGRAFVAGADIQQMKDMSPAEARAFGEYGNSVFRKIESTSKPVIAANGFALGGGWNLPWPRHQAGWHKGKIRPAGGGTGNNPGFA